MKRILAIFSVFCFLNSCETFVVFNSVSLTIKAVSEQCLEPAIFPSKTYDELKNAKEVFEYKNDKYTLNPKRINIYISTSKNKGYKPEALCCKCQEQQFALVKNLVFDKNGEQIDGTVLLDINFEYKPKNYFYTMKNQT